MGLPWIQVATEVIEHAAPELSIVLDWNEDSALAGLVRMFRWAIDRCPEDRPPSAGDVVKGKQAARLLAQAARFKGDPEAFVAACEQVWPEPLLERTSEGIRVRGLARYDATWRKANPTKAMSWRDGDGSPGKPLRNRSETAPIPSGKAPVCQAEIETETKTERLPSEVVAAAKNLPRTVEPPTTPPEDWTGEDFERWCQSRRQAAGLIPEKHHPHRGLASWWSAATMTPGVTVAALKAAFLAFGSDPFWEKQGFPFRAFLSQWDKYTRAEVQHAAAG